MLGLGLVLGKLCVRVRVSVNVNVLGLGLQREGGERGRDNLYYILHPIL